MTVAIFVLLLTGWIAVVSRITFSKPHSTTPLNFSYPIPLIHTFILSLTKSLQECPKCKGQVKSGDIAIVAPKLGLALSWHPSCFCCSTCEELLVDLTYCLKDGKLFCERHYAESCKPRCAACDEVSLHWIASLKTQGLMNWAVGEALLNISAWNSINDPYISQLAWISGRESRDEMKWSCSSSNTWLGKWFHFFSYFFLNYNRQNINFRNLSEGWVNCGRLDVVIFSFWDPSRWLDPTDICHRYIIRKTFIVPKHISTSEYLQ